MNIYSALYDFTLYSSLKMHDTFRQKGIYVHNISSLQPHSVTRTSTRQSFHALFHKRIYTGWSKFKHSGFLVLFCTLWHMSDYFDQYLCQLGLNSKHKRVGWTNFVFKLMWDNRWKKNIFLTILTDGKNVYNV